MCLKQTLDTLSISTHSYNVPSPISTHSHNALFEKYYVCTSHKLIESGCISLSKRMRYSGAVKRCRGTLWNSLTAKNRTKVTSPGNSSSRSSKIILPYRAAKAEVASSDLASYLRMRKCSRLLDGESISDLDLSAHIQAWQVQ